MIGHVFLKDAKNEYIKGRVSGIIEGSKRFNLFRKPGFALEEISVVNKDDSISKYTVFTVEGDRSEFKKIKKKLKASNYDVKLLGF